MQRLASEKLAKENEAINTSLRSLAKDSTLSVPIEVDVSEDDERTPVTDYPIAELKELSRDTGSFSKPRVPTKKMAIGGVVLAIVVALFAALISGGDDEEKNDKPAVASGKSETKLSEDVTKETKPSSNVVPAPPIEKSELATKVKSTEAVNTAKKGEVVEQALQEDQLQPRVRKRITTPRRPAGKPAASGEEVLSNPYR
ncbi:MAG: hypothetical protein IPJ88_15305 [Myxococcales bacterium]|nr:MAG: hypothetical protein IPJ88_15305 [Myxococcales bacterium]